MNVQGGRAMDMDRWLVTSFSPLALAAAVSCGSSGGAGAPSAGDGGAIDATTTPNPDASSADDATAGTDGSSSEAGGGEAGGGEAGANVSDASDSGGAAVSSADVPQIHKHINRDGLFVDAAFTKSALMGHTLHIDATFAGTVTGHVFASPLYVTDGVNHKGTFYVATENNNLYALDETTGTSAIPSKNAGTPAGSTGCGASNVIPLGITGTPAIDLTTRLIVFDAATAASAGGKLSKHTIHAWSIDDFSEKWSLDVTTLTDLVAGAFQASIQNQRSAVLIVNGTAYVAYGGHYGDCGSYNGWLVGVPLSATQTTVSSLAKEYATPANQAGMWAAGGPSSDGTSIFDATGNTPTPADLDPTGGNWKGAYSVLRFAAGPVFTPGPANFWHALADDSNGDDDLGGSAPLVVDAPAITPSKLLVQLGKDGYAYVVDRTNMGGEMSPLAAVQVMNDEISNVPAWATTASGTYVAMVGNNGGAGAGCMTGSGELTVIKLSATAQITVPWCANNKGGGSPSITSSDGTNDMLVWTVGTDAAGGGSDGQIHAWDLETGASVVPGSDVMANTRHFTTPIFVHGRAFVVGDGRLYALR